MISLASGGGKKKKDAKGLEQPVRAVLANA